jgi:hypothetical protein
MVSRAAARRMWAARAGVGLRVARAQRAGALCHLAAAQRGVQRGVRLPLRSQVPLQLPLRPREQKAMNDALCNAAVRTTGEAIALDRQVGVGGRGAGPGATS